MYNLNKTKNILYASISIILGIFIINWLFPDKNTDLEKFTQINFSGSQTKHTYNRDCKPRCKAPYSCSNTNIPDNKFMCRIYAQVSELNSDQIVELIKKNKLEASHMKELKPSQIFNLPSKEIGIVITTLMDKNLLTLKDLSELTPELISKLPSKELGIVIKTLMENNLLTLERMSKLSPEQISNLQQQQIL